MFDEVVEIPDFSRTERLVMQDGQLLTTQDAKASAPVATDNGQPRLTLRARFPGRIVIASESTSYTSRTRIANTVFRHRLDNTYLAVGGAGASSALFQGGICH